MQHGLFIPPFGHLADPSLVGELAQLAELAGWDGVFLWDHLQYRSPVTHVTDPWITMAAVAMRTTRVRIGALVTPLARRRPAVVARQLVALDLLSGGRMVLGAGLGLDQSGRELSSFGEELDAPTRAAMLDEALPLIRALCAGEDVSHRGDHYLADGVRFLPGSVQKPIPAWLGARWPNRAPLRRAARYEGVFIIDVTGPADVDELVTTVAATRDELGLSGPFDIVASVDPGADPGPWAAAGTTWLLTGFTPFGADVREVRSVIEAGPPN
jgi:alkanesulfonate monooxygenase SsuD/methylene tetrahydromethanopterin reductase-like flavin-dependent oxidoreductase (luciferase family)